MECIYSQQLLDSHDYPWGTVEETSQVGLVQKDGMEFVKGSFDRCLGVKRPDSSRDLDLIEYKCRVSHNRTCQEEDRIDELRACGQMEDDSIFCEVESDDPDRFMFVKDETELCQLLHHAFTGSKESCHHAVGNTKMLLSCTRMGFASDLLEAYHQVLRLIFDRCLKPFYANSSPRKDLSASKEIMATIERAVEVNKETVVDMDTFQFNCKLFRTATQKKNLPLPPCKWIGPLAAASWNRVKPGSDINTQMMWDMNFVSPVRSPQCALIKQLGILQPQYAIHRISMILKYGDKDLDGFSCAMAWKKHLRRD